MEEFPGDVLSNIFIRLLAKQVAQMRSVNKSWNALLSSKSFIKSHLHHSIQNNHEILLYFYGEFGSNSGFSAHPSTTPELELRDFIKSPVRFKFGIVKVIGSVNGLICFKKSSYDHLHLYIWNPSLSAISTLPPYSLRYPATATEDTGNALIRVDFRFGFDPKADDYIVVKLAATLVQPKNFVMEMVQEWLQVEVYSMGKGSWKPITQRFPSHITGIVSRQDQVVCVDGHDGFLHWLCIIGGKRNVQTIVAFDLGAETFHEIPLPDSMLHYNSSNCTNVLGVLAGKLCVMSYVDDGECEVWVMAEHGVVESWSKHHAFSQFRNILPVGFTLGNEFLFQIDEDDIEGEDEDEDDDGDDDYDEDERALAYYVDNFVRCYGLYDPVAAKTKVFKMFDPISTFVEYVDSLVWVAPDERVITTRKRGNFRKRKLPTEN